MNKFVSSCLCMLLTLAFASQLQAQGDPQAGQSKTAICAACHGPTGNSISPLFPNLAGQNARYMLKQLQDIKSGARSVVEMTGMLAALNDQDLADIAAYYEAQEPKIAGAEAISNDAYGLGPEELLALGEQIYRNGNLETGVPACTGCHSPTGAGNAPAGYPAIGGQNRDYIAKQLGNFRNNLRTNDGDTRIMRGVAARMTDLEIQAVSNYISGLH